MIRLLAGVLCLVVVLALVPGSRAASPPTPLVREVNGVRAGVGAPPLRPARTLARAARRESRRVLDSQRFEHGAAAVGGGRFTLLGEVLGLQPGSDFAGSRT